MTLAESREWTAALSRADHAPAPKVDVWIACGLRLRWRVVSMGHTYGEWEHFVDAQAFIELLVAGNPDLERLV